MSSALREYLQQELDRRRKKNERYSIRGFARDLGLDPTALSRFLAGTRAIGAKAAQKILAKLKLDPTARATLLRSLVAPQDHGIPTDDYYVPLTAEQLEQMDEWIYSAILALTNTRGKTLDALSISKFFGIALSKVESVTQRLIELGMLKKTEKGFRKTFKASTAAFQKGSPAIKRIHAGYLERARESLLGNPDEIQDISGITLLIEPEKLPEAMRRIKEFRRSLAQFLEAPESEAGPDLYRINVQLFPLMSPQSKK